MSHTIQNGHSHYAAGAMPAGRDDKAAGPTTGKHRRSVTDDATGGGRGNGTDATGGTGTDALRRMAKPAVTRVDPASVEIDDKRAVSLRMNRPGRGVVDVTISDRGVSFAASAPPLGAPTQAPAKATQTVDFADLETMTDAQETLMSELEAALENVDTGTQDAPTRAGIELAKGRLATLKEPSFWHDVGLRLEKFNVHTLANSKEASIQSEARLDIAFTPNSPRITSSGRRIPVPGLADGKLTVLIDGKSHAAALHDNGRQVKADGKDYPLRFDSDTGEWMVVTKHKPLTANAARAGAVAGEVNQRTAATLVNTLPPVRGEGGVQVHGLKGVAGRPGVMEMTYARAEGTVERVRISDRGISFHTYLNPDLPGVKDDQGYTTLKTGYSFKDMANWGTDGSQQVADFRAMLDDLDTSGLDRLQRDFVDTAKARLDLLQDPGFWADVDADTAARLSADLPGVGAIEVTDGQPVIVDRRLHKTGETKTHFYVRNDEGKKVAIEPKGDNKATLDGQDYHIATDHETGDFVLVRDYKSTEQVRNEVVGKEVNRRLAADDAPVRTASTAATTVAGPDNAAATAIDDALTGLINDPQQFLPILTSAIDDAARV